MPEFVDNDPLLPVDSEPTDELYTGGDIEDELLLTSDMTSSPADGAFADDAFEDETSPESYRAIEAEIATLSAQSDQLAGELNAFDEARGENHDQDAIIDAFYDRYDQAVQTAHEQGTPVAIPSSADVPGVPDALPVAMAAYADIQERVAGLRGKMETHVPEKAADLAAQAADVERRIDYRKVVAEAFAQDDMPARVGEDRHFNFAELHLASKVIHIRQALEGGSAADYQDLVYAENALDDATRKCTEAGLFVDADTKTAPDTQEAYTPEQATEIIQRIELYDRIRENYKNTGSATNLPVREQITRIRHTAHAISDVSGPKETIDATLRSADTASNEALRTALTERLKSLVGELPNDFDERGSDAFNAFVEQARHIAAADALDRTVITNIEEGQNSLPFAFSEAELRNLLIDNVPALAIDEVKRLEFRTFTQEEDASPDTIGKCLPDEATGGKKVIISDVRFRKYYEDEKQALADVGIVDDLEERALLTTKERLKQTIVHEYSHALHAVLPAAVLAEWEAAIADDPTHVTNYVKDRHEDGEFGAEAEDFCDSAATFTRQPDLLHTVSEARDTALEKIYAEFMPYYGVVLKPYRERTIASNQQYSESQGMTPEQVRRYYLPHEPVRNNVET